MVYRKYRMNLWPVSQFTSLLGGAYNIRGAAKNSAVLLATTMMLSLPVQAFAANSCSEMFVSQASHQSGKIFAKLPRESSERFREVVAAVRRQFHATNSYAIVDLRPFLSKADSIGWAYSVPPELASQIHDGRVLYEQNGKLIIKETEPGQLEGIAKLQLWFKAVIAEAAPGLGLATGFTNVRNSSVQGDGLKFSDWHLDGGRASVTLAVYGSGTEILGPAPLKMTNGEYGMRGAAWEAYCTDCKPYVVPTGHALIFFGTESGAEASFKPTIHRTPEAQGFRTLFVIRY